MSDALVLISAREQRLQNAAEQFLAVAKDGDVPHLTDYLVEVFTEAVVPTKPIKFRWGEPRWRWSFDLCDFACGFGLGFFSAWGGRGFSLTLDLLIVTVQVQYGPELLS